MATSNLAALLAMTGDTEELAKYQRIKRAGSPEGAMEAQAAAPADASLALNPLFKESDGFSLAGNAPIGGGAGGIGSALLANAAPQAAPAAEVPKRKRLEETTGGKMALALAEKKKNLKWWMPEQFANRNDRDLSQALEMARLEMAGDEGGVRDAQWWLDRTDQKNRWDTAQTQGKAKLDAEIEDEAARRRLEEQRIELGRANLDLDKQRLGTHEKELSEARAMRALLTQQKAAAEAVEQASKMRDATFGKGYDAAYNSDPASTGKFGDFAAKLLQKNPETLPEEVVSSQVQASQAGALPPMMSKPADRPVTIKERATGKLYWQYPDGRIVPVPEKGR